MEIHSWALLKAEGGVKLNNKPADKADESTGYVYFLRFTDEVLREAIDAMDYGPANERGCRANVKRWCQSTRQWLNPATDRRCRD